MSVQSGRAGTVTSALPGAPVAAPPLPAKPSSRHSRRSALVIAAVVIALLVYSWIETDASVSQFFTAFFGPKGLIRNVLPEAVPPQANQFWPGIQAAATTFPIPGLTT